MPITLGNTSISGLAAGGLPSGVVNATSLASGAVTKAKIGYAGQVLQCIVTEDSAVGTVTNDDTIKLTTNITPFSASSKILVMCSWFWAGDNPNGHWDLRRNGSVLAGNNTGNQGMTGHEDAYPHNIYDAAAAHSFWLDSPNTTSSVEYRLQYAHTGRNGGTIYWNRGRTTNRACVSTLTLMEISG